MSSVYDVYVCPYVCTGTYGAILGIRLTEGCQSVGNKRASKKQLMCELAKLFLGFRTN